MENAVKRHMTDLRAASDERNARIAAVRERERSRRAADSGGVFRGKRARPSTNVAQAGKEEKDFLPEDGADAPPDDGLNLSSEVRALMAQLDKRGAQEEVAEEDVPKVSYHLHSEADIRCTSPRGPTRSCGNLPPSSSRRPSRPTICPTTNASRSFPWRHGGRCASTTRCALLGARRR